MDPEGIHRCLLNLVTNAIDACLDTDPEKGRQRAETLRKLLAP